ncbi:MAG: ATP-dependent RecD-like DNA helicase [Chloroflexota bacterium]
MDNLSGSVERIVYYNPETGYSVLNVRPEQRNIPDLDSQNLVTVVGNLPEISPGTHVQLSGRWVKHPKYGLQFQVEVCELTLPATVSGIKRYLSSGLIRGIGPRLAENIVDHFGAQTLEVIEQHPERLIEVPNIGPKRSQQILTAWEEQRQVKDIMLFLHAHGVSTNLAIKIYKNYGDQSLEVVQNDPYRLSYDIFGVGFKTADRLAQSLGLPPDHPSRLEAGLLYCLNEMSEDGHVYAPRDLLQTKAAELLAVDADGLTFALERLTAADRVHCDHLPPPTGAADPEFGVVRETAAEYYTPAVYLTPFFYSETGLANNLRKLAQAPISIGGLPQCPDERLSAEQRSAVNTALTHPVSVLTGGPGTGKTTTIHALIAALDEMGKRYALAAPTGRAAKRLSEATGCPASTIHRLLGYSPTEGFKLNEHNPLSVDMLVVDEVSMLDLLLAHHLLKALRPRTHLLLVGDVDQLPSVGAGNVLSEVIDSGLVPVTRLDVIFRQAADSQIITNAHRINQGKMPLFPQTSQDFFLFPAQNAEEAANWVLDVVCNRIPSKFGLHPPKEIQVLSPMYRGPAGVNTLNDRLQAALNPASSTKPEQTFFGQRFRVGDRVMQIRNNYFYEVFNGDMGELTDISAVEHTLSVNFEDRTVTYDWSEADQWVLAYAVSVHKSQGGEFPAVVVPLITQHYIMLQRNLLYTAVTRAQKICVLIGNRKAIAIAVANNRVARRFSALAWRLGSLQSREL